MSSKMMRTAVMRRTIKKPSSVKRSLFGSPDREGLKAALKTQSGILDKENRQEWNYDFKHDLPMSGRWNWTVLDQAPVTPKKAPMKRKLDVLRDHNGVRSPVKRRHLAVNDKENLECPSTPSTPVSCRLAASCQTSTDCNNAFSSIPGMDKIIAATRGVTLKPVKRRSPRINSSPMISK